MAENNNNNNNGKEKKSKAPTAQKRLIQSQKRRDANKAFKSRINTAVKALTTAMQKKEPTTEKLSLLYSLMDKGVKKGIIKLSKANRYKSSYHAKAKAS